jgi:hypothetical protein
MVAVFVEIEKMRLASARQSQFMRTIRCEPIVLCISRVSFSAMFTTRNPMIPGHVHDTIAEAESINIQLTVATCDGSVVILLYS